MQQTPHPNRTALHMLTKHHFLSFAVIAVSVAVAIAISVTIAVAIVAILATDIFRTVEEQCQFVEFLFFIQL